MCRVGTRGQLVMSEEYLAGFVAVSWKYIFLVFLVFSANEKENKIHNIFGCSYSGNSGSPAALIPM